jgi:protein SCO1/2
MSGFVQRPLNWLLVAVGVLLIATMCFAIFQPVTVVPRITTAPSYELTDQNGQLITQQSFAGKIVVYGFGYTNDPTGVIDQTVTDLERVQTEVQSQNIDAEIALALVLFDNERDTPERRREFAAQRRLDLNQLGADSGDGETLEANDRQGLELLRSCATGFSHAESLYQQYHCDGLRLSASRTICAGR